MRPPLASSTSSTTEDYLLCNTSNENILQSVRLSEYFELIWIGSALTMDLCDPKQLIMECIVAIKLLKHGTYVYLLKIKIYSYLNLSSWEAIAQDLLYQSKG